MIGFVLGVAVTAAAWIYEARTGFFSGKLNKVLDWFADPMG